MKIPTSVAVNSLVKRPTSVVTILMVASVRAVVAVAVPASLLPSTVLLLYRSGWVTTPVREL